MREPDPGAALRGGRFRACAGGAAPTPARGQRIGRRSRGRADDRSRRPRESESASGGCAGSRSACRLSRRSTFRSLAGRDEGSHWRMVLSSHRGARRAPRHALRAGGDLRSALPVFRVRR